MKAGDKLYCTKTIEKHGVTFFLENNFYTIELVRINRVQIMNERPNNDSSSFYTIKKDTTDEFKFHEHFCTLIQYRKRKLKKLNE
jgi:hypothetical protein